MEKACTGTLKLNSWVNSECQEIDEWRMQGWGGGLMARGKVGEQSWGSCDRLRDALHPAHGKKQRRASIGRGPDGVFV